MIDLPDFMDVPKRLVLGLLRVLWWLAIDVGVQMVGWSVGWLFLRAITWGRLPSQPWDQTDAPPSFVHLLVSLLGVIVLALAIYLLSSQSWPD
jgi:hypothetical protein